MYLEQDLITLPCLSGHMVLMLCFFLSSDLRYCFCFKVLYWPIYISVRFCHVHVSFLRTYDLKCVKVFCFMSSFAKSISLMADLTIRNFVIWTRVKICINLTTSTQCCSIGGILFAFILYFDVDNDINTSLLNCCMQNYLYKLFNNLIYFVLGRTLYCLP